MPKFEIEYSMYCGSVVIEAESEDAAEALFYDNPGAYIDDLDDAICIDWIGEVEE